MQFLIQSLAIVPLSLTLVLASCAIQNEQAAFDLDPQASASVDENGFPRFIGPQYHRDTPLPRNIERNAIEEELLATAKARQEALRPVDTRSKKREADQLVSIARSHRALAEAQIEADCETDEAGIVRCKSE